MSLQHLQFSLIQGSVSEMTDTKNKHRHLKESSLWEIVWREDKPHFILVSIAGWQTKPLFFQIISLRQKEGWDKKKP